MTQSAQPDQGSSDQTTAARPTSDANSVALPVSLSFSSTISTISTSEVLDSYQPSNAGSGLPYLDSLPSLAPSRNSQTQATVQHQRESRASSVLSAVASPRLAPRPFDSPSLAHLTPSRSSLDVTAAAETSTPKDAGQDSPTIARSTYDSPDIYIDVPGSTAFNHVQENQRLVAADSPSTSTKRFSKVLHGLGLFGSTSKRNSSLVMKKASNPKHLHIDTSIPVQDPAHTEQRGSAGGPRLSPKPRSEAASPLPSPGVVYKPPIAHHLVGGLGVSHVQGLSSTSSFVSQEGKYPAARTDAFSTGLVPVLNIDDSSSSIYSLNSPRRPYTPGSFTNGPRTPLSATASPSTSYFDEKKLGGATASIIEASLNSSPSATGATHNIKMWGDYDAESEPDDYLHEPDAEKYRNASSAKEMLSPRGLLNIGTLTVIGLGLILLFGGYPVISWLSRSKASTKGGFNLGGANATGQVADLKIGRGLIDPDTPESVKTRTTLNGSGKKMNLVFSDEFNRDGRSFYPGDDPFWTAVDLHYWGTENYEWYDPSAVTTANGSLVITLDEVPTHNLNFRGGMLQSWNQFCFTGGYIEVSMVLPGAPDVAGLWPAAWTMGNLGRAGYGASTDGMWPYTYDSCDVGTLPNQTYVNGTGPIAAQTTGVYVEKYGPYLSYLPGQRLSRCTCNSSNDHPGPRHADGTWVGRSAPEIDIIEAAASHTRGSRGHASMSAQIAPFNTGYNLTDGPGTTEFFSDDAALNSYTGSPLQQAASGLVYTKRGAYQETLGQFSSYGYEYNPGSDPDSYILWTLDGAPMWQLNSKALGPDAGTQISQRPIPYEPMYILLNLGISSSFTTVDWRHLNWPAKMLVDYVRVWQVEGEENIGCDPENAPTAAYIEAHKEVYYNANLTTWTEPKEKGGYGAKFPGNSMLGQC
ncbi:putative glucan synthase subunit protein [Mycosarcoma maydis]|uniref:Glucan synthase subunit protein n=1 Tax=Mycosarcoma maydis TaxID=5270 RepID=A0A0D1CCS8_MYCMD|nr:putative glucan synthase subunit protein [Ustilago maydis 521]KIS70932.1 putative glucan synthase subunit protein [Ustilago maydis 521]|eukprot:XP_011386883.1 putative glucan synthase subunit protein [Ustilago maydis 521]